MAHPLSYPDSSFLVSLYCRDSHSPAACKHMSGHLRELPFSPLHRIECRNALRNAAARAAISTQDCRAAFRRMEDDLRSGFLIHAPISWTDMLARADDLSERHREKDGQRTLDLLHVAVALEIRASVFLSFDNRQIRLARAAGLQVAP